MEWYTLQQRIEIIKFTLKWVNICFSVVVKHFVERKLLEQFVLLEEVSDVKNKNCELRSRTTENIVAVAESVSTNVITPGRKVYKVQLTQPLNPADHLQRRIFADWVLEMHANDPEFY